MRPDADTRVRGIRALNAQSSIGEQGSRYNNGYPQSLRENGEWKK